jgi:hypothetical protein
MGAGSRTVLVLHGGHVSAAVPLGERDLLDLGLRILAVCRPGYGRTPRNDRRDAHGLWRRCCAAVSVPGGRQTCRGRRDVARRPVGGRPGRRPPRVGQATHPRSRRIQSSLAGAGDSGGRPLGIQLPDRTADVALDRRAGAVGARRLLAHHVAGAVDRQWRPGVGGPQSCRSCRSAGPVEVDAGKPRIPPRPPASPSTPAWRRGFDAGR